LSSQVFAELTCDCRLTTKTIDIALQFRIGVQQNVTIDAAFGAGLIKMMRPASAPIAPNSPQFNPDDRTVDSNAVDRFVALTGNQIGSGRALA
jgi:hypothetical protein